MSTMIGQPSKGLTSYEILFSCVVLVTTLGMFATILSSVSLILEEINQKHKDYRKDREILNKFFFSKQGQYLNQELKVQLVCYLKYLYIGHKEQNQSVQLDSLLEKFPIQLQKNVKQVRYQVLVKKFQTITRNFSNVVIDALVDNIEEQYLMPNQILYSQSIFQEPKLYLVIKGGVSLEYSININKQQKQYQSRRQIKLVEQDGEFNQKEFFTGQQSPYQARSTDFTTVLVIKRTQFLQIIKNFDTDLQVFCQIKDQALFNGLCKQSSINCLICDKNLHSEQYCNLLQYKPNRYYLAIRDYNASINRNRLRYYRQVYPINDYKSIKKCQRKIINNKYDKHLIDKIQELDFYVDQMFEKIFILENSQNTISEFNEESNEEDSSDQSSSFSSKSQSSSQSDSSSKQEQNSDKSQSITSSFISDKQSNLKSFNNLISEQNSNASIQFNLNKHNIKQVFSFQDDDYRTSNISNRVKLPLPTTDIVLIQPDENTKRSMLDGIDEINENQQGVQHIQRQSIQGQMPSKRNQFKSQKQILKNNHLLAITNNQLHKRNLFIKQSSNLSGRNSPKVQRSHRKVPTTAKMMASHTYKINNSQSPVIPDFNSFNKLNKNKRKSIQIMQPSSRFRSSQKNLIDKNYLDFKLKKQKNFNDLIQSQVSIDNQPNIISTMDQLPTMKNIAIKKQNETFYSTDLQSEFQQNEKKANFWKVEIDLIKSFKNYQQHNNIEQIVEYLYRRKVKWLSDKKESKNRKNFFKTLQIRKQGYIDLQAIQNTAYQNFNN